ncbi:MAG: hypothetical protein WCK65_11875 [Rhodospirillaceae bacterium]
MVIEGTGGIRKLRWQLLAYAKGVADDLTAEQKGRMAALVAELMERRRT